MAVFPPFLFALVRAVCGSAGVLLDTGRAFCNGITDMADGNREEGSNIYVLVLRRGAAPYIGRRYMRAGTVSVSDKTDNGIAPPVQGGFSGGMPLRHSVLRGYVCS